ncbi:hypothetical protein FGIG_00174 [Fasciola gigantica]|uniref:Uncharacterized protein n=1 Tax=Fasciola gigantica TaxID=46835 RepID=A0A504Y8K4_FASGI|nr:hypothetical protein FGIG_00174 [Fasciola gigantica]
MLPFVHLHVLVQPLCDQALPPSIRRGASPAPSDPIKYNGRTSAHLLSPPNVWIITPRESTADERIENHQSNTIPRTAWRLRHSAGGPMGSECHLSQPYTSTSCWDSGTSELNLRPSVSRFSALSPGMCGRSTGGNLKLVDAQRRARSAWNLSSNSGPGNTQHVPSHIRDALLNGLSCTESHLSMYSGTMTPSSDSEDEAHGNQPVNETSYALDNRSVVTPNAPKSILIMPRSHPNLSATDYRSSTYSIQTLTKNQKYYNKSCHTYSNARSSTLLSGESSLFKDGQSTRFRRKIPSFSSLVDRQASPVPPIITVSASPCARNSVDSRRPVSNVTSIENFTRDAQSSLVRINYDPYALVQRQPPQTTTDRRARAHTSSWEDRGFGSSISSDRFSQDSAQSLPLPLGTLPHTLDRRKRYKRLQTRL